MPCSLVATKQYKIQKKQYHCLKPDHFQLLNEKKSCQPIFEDFVLFRGVLDFVGLHRVSCSQNMFSYHYWAMRWTFAEHVAPWHATVAPVQVQKRTPRVNWPQVDIFSLTNEDVAGSPQKSP